MIDLLRENDIKKIAPKYILLFGLTAVYFYAYMYLTDKISYNSDWYYEMQEYIFRSMHVRFSIYAALNPSRIHILDYPGQSILYSLFFFVPRAIWTSKPWPYIDYYMRGVLGLSSLSEVTYHMLELLIIRNLYPISDLLVYHWLCYLRFGLCVVLIKEKWYANF